LELAGDSTREPRFAREGLGNHQKRRFAGIKALSRTRTGDRLLTMENSPCCCVTWERRLVARFPCNLAGFSARSTLASKDPEPPRRAPTCPQNLAPKDAVSVVDRANRGDLRPGVRRIARFGAPSGTRQASSADRVWSKPGAIFVGDKRRFASPRTAKELLQTDHARHLRAAKVEVAASITS
jgi:hypothetical protein